MILLRETAIDVLVRKGLLDRGRRDDPRHRPGTSRVSRPDLGPHAVTRNGAACRLTHRTLAIASHDSQMQLSHMAQGSALAL
jgi:hypothetical protein